MTLKARILVGGRDEPELKFPAPDFHIEPRTLDIAATQIFNNDNHVTRTWIYPAIGFDHKTAKQHAEIEAAERRIKAAKLAREPEQGDKYYRYIFKGLGLELIVTMLLSCLGAPETARCPCRAHRDENGCVVPHGPATANSPDVLVDYGDFTVLAEVTTRRDMDEESVSAQFKSANSHARTALSKKGGAKRVYCIMVCRLDLKDHSGLMQKHLAKAQEKLHSERPGRAKFIALSIREMGHVGYMLQKLYCQGRPNDGALTGHPARLGRAGTRRHARKACQGRADRRPPET